MSAFIHPDFRLNGPSGLLWKPGHDHQTLEETAPEAAAVIRRLVRGEALQVQTSGSTGAPKTIHVPTDRILASLALTRQYISLQPGQTALLSLPLDHIGGIMMLARCMHWGLDTTWQPPTANPLAGPAQRFDFLSLVPYQLKHILAHKTSQARLEQAQFALIGGGPVDLSLFEKVAPLAVRVFHTYGMTETLSHFAVQEIKPGAEPGIFRVLEGMEIAVGADGGLEVRGPVTGGQWMHTQDRVERIDDRHFRYLGRMDQVINSGGIKIRSEELEDRIRKILDQEGIQADFYVIGEPDQDLGERVVMVTEGKEIPERLRDRLKSGLPRYHAPRRYVQVAKLPRSSMGKIRRLSPEALQSLP